MKRSEKRVLTRVMESPCTLHQLYYSIRLPTFRIREAVSSLLESGDIQFDGVKYHINKVPRDNVARRAGVEWPPAPANDEQPVSRLVLQEGKLVEERGEGLLQEPVVMEDKPLDPNDPPKPLPKWLHEPKTRKRDRE